MKSLFLRTLLFALILPLLAGCPSLFAVSEDDDSEEARIIPGKSIDNVKIGDDSTTVITKLGEPDEIDLETTPAIFSCLPRESIVVSQ